MNVVMNLKNKFHPNRTKINRPIQPRVRPIQSVQPRLVQSKVQPVQPIQLIQPRVQPIQSKVQPIQIPSMNNTIFGKSHACGCGGK